MKSSRRRSLPHQKTSVIETEKPKFYAGPQDEGHEFFDLPTSRPIFEHSRHWSSLEEHAEQVYRANTPNALSTPKPKLRRDSPGIARQQPMMTINTTVGAAVTPPAQTPSQVLSQAKNLGTQNFIQHDNRGLCYMSYLAPYRNQAFIQPTAAVA